MHLTVREYMQMGNPSCQVGNKMCSEGFESELHSI